MKRGDATGSTVTVTALEGFASRWSHAGRRILVGTTTR